MLVSSRILLQAGIGALAIVWPAFLHGQTVVTDTFESGAFASGWAATTGATIASGTGAGGSTKFANVAATSSALGARFDAVQAGGMANFSIDMHFKIQASSTARQFHLQVSTDSAAIGVSSPAFNLRYQSGSWALFDGTSWQSVHGLNTVTAGSWHRLRVTGRNWGQSSAYCDIELSAPGGSTFTSSVGGLYIFHTTSPKTSLARYFVFTGNFDSCPGFSVDNVTASANTPAPVPLLLNPSSMGTASQSGGTTAALALDNNPATISTTTNAAGSYWQVEMTRPVVITRVQVVAPTGAGYSGVVNGLVLKVYNLRDQMVFSQAISGVADGGVWSVDLPAGVNGRILRLELPQGVNNGAGDQRVAVADVRLFSPAYVPGGTNLALNKTSYMVRLSDTLNPPSYANDGNLSTIMETTDKTVDGYWETDLGQERALSCIRVIGIDSDVERARLAHATVRLYDANHDSVFSQHLAATPSVFDVILPGPVNARYVRVGFENKERTHATGGIEWWLKIREVEAYGRPVEQAGILSFSASPAQITSGQSAQLQWQTDSVQEVRIYPSIGSVGAFTGTSGSGQITVSPGTTTEYLLVAGTPSADYVRHVTVQVNGQPLPPRISEFVASNKFSLRDGFKNAPDWIEIHNPNGAPLDISGYCLSDTAVTPAKWSFPTGTTIPANGYLVVCASNSNLSSPDAAGYLHANFALSGDGESVVLSSPGGATVLDTITFAGQDDDLAYGRTPDGNWSFIEPTPGEPNLGVAYAGWLEAPGFSQTRGVRSTAFSLTLTDPNPASQIYYSLDGTEPAVAYTGPLSITTNRSVRATVRRAGYRSPRVVTHSYLFPSQVPTGPNMRSTYASGTYLTRQQQGFLDLPLVSLSLPELPDDYVETEGSAEFFLPGTATPIQVNCGVERFGGAWTEFAKKSYKLSFSPEYGARKLEAPLFNGFDRGFPVKEAFDSLELRAGNHDMVSRGCYLSGRFIEDTTLEMGSLNPHGRYVHMFVNGSYWGMYDMRERMVDAFLAEYLGGAKEDYVNVRGNDNYDNNSFIPGTPEPPNRALWETVRANRSSYAAIKDKVDVQHLIDFMLIWFFGTNENEYRCAGPIAAGSGFKFWLADSDGYLAFDWSGGFPAVNAALVNDRTANAGPGSIFGALVTEGHPDFKILLADRIQKHFFTNGALTGTRNQARITARINEIQNAIVAECARWGYRTPENWASTAETVKTSYLPYRANNVLAFLRARGLFPSLAAPVLAQHGGSVDRGYPLTFSGTTGTVYFTLDGSDPRSPGGAIAAGALSWSGTTQNLIPMGSTWKYWDRGSLPAADWKTSEYNDGSWASGPAQLGYGDGGEATLVSFGPNSNAKYTTTYFRKTFTVAIPAQISQLNLGLVRDDGAVVYLNGVEVARSNMPAGSIGYSTWASSAIGGADESAVQSFSIPANLLVAGTNLIAVELHQHNGTSTDLSFDLSLTGSASGAAAILNANTRVMARVFDGTSWSALTDATFQVAYPLVASGPYLFSDWSATADAGSFPANMTFYQTSTAVPDPGLAVEMDKVWNLPYNRTSRSRINGLGVDGFSFINTDNPQSDLGSGYVGAAVLALNTTGAQDIRVTWTGGTVTVNERDYGIQLQYRVGDSGGFTYVPDSGGNPVEYLKNTTGHSQIIGPVTLPAAANNKPLVQLRWKYYYRSGTSGSRPQLRVDDIQVSAGNPAPDRVVVAQAPLVGQTGRVLGPITVQARSAAGALATGFNGQIQLSTVPASAIAGTIFRNAVNGTAVFDDVVIPDSGEFILRAVSTGLTDGDADNTTRVVGLTGDVVPLYIQGKSPINDERIPWAARFSVAGLRPLATYRFANRMRAVADLADSDGAGNMIFATAGLPHVRSVAGVSFQPADLNAGHGEFTTDAAGGFSGWFLTEPTGNERFTPGGTLNPLLLLNDGEGGTTAFHSLVANDAVQVMAFGTAAGQGTAVHGTAGEPAGSFVVFYSSADGTARPVAATPVEATGAAIDGALYADFYESQAAGQGGRWGTMVPNSLASGLGRIETRDAASGNVLSSLVLPGGQRPTTGLSGGLNPVGIMVPGAAAHPFVRWQAARFSLAELTPGGIGAANGTPARDGISNLLKYAFGMDPFTNGQAGLPVTAMVDVAGQKRLAFQYRRLTGIHGLVYEIQAADNLAGWGNADSLLVAGEETGPGPVGTGTENVTRYLPVSSGSGKRFLRLSVRLDD